MKRAALVLCVLLVPWAERNACSEPQAVEINAVSKSEPGKSTMDKLRPYIDDSADVSLLVQIVYSGTFELGYSYDFAVEAVLQGRAIDLLKPRTGTVALNADGVLILPPMGAETAKDLYERYLEKEPVRAVLNLQSTGTPLDQAETFRPAPGTGMGEFLLPGVLAGDSGYCRLLSAHVIPGSLKLNQLGE